ncbi:MAG: hypothetical protein AB7F35_23735 [Acetobacteraceae bacterium]
MSAAALTPDAVDRRRSVPLGRIVLMGALWLVCCLLLVLREPGVILRAELWAEDGWVWFPDAYHHGWASLLRPHSGYLQTFPRLASLAALPFPLTWLPTLFAAIALAMQALPAAFLLSPRLDAAWPSRLGRVLFALVFVMLPNTYEGFVNVTNTQWYLAILAFLVLVSRPGRVWPSGVFDAGVLGVGGLTGPFCLFLLPVAAWAWWADRDRARLLRLLLVGGACVVQALCLFATMDTTRTTAPLGAGVVLLARIVSQQVFLGGLLGVPYIQQIRESWLWSHDIVPVLAALIGLALLARAIWRGPPMLRMAALSGGLLFAAALLRPQVSDADPQWVMMTVPVAGQRYYLIPMLIWIGALLSLLGDPRPLPRLAAAALLVLLPFGIKRDWYYPWLSRTDFAETARVFAAAPPGTMVVFHIRPTDRIPMVLIRKDR